MRKISILYLFIAALLISSCVSKKQKENTLSFSGAFALYPLAVKWSEEYQKEHPDIRFNISGGGAGKGMADALAGAVDLGMFSREISQEEINQGVWWVGLTIDAVLPTISEKNPHLGIIQKRGLTKEEFKGIFIDGTITDWSQIVDTPEKLEIKVYTRSDACGAAGTWAKYLGGSQENLQGVGVFGDPGLAEVIVNDAAGIGYNNTVYAYDIKTRQHRPGIVVIPIDINGNGTIDDDEAIYDNYDAVQNGIASGKYPSPPARELYFVSNGRPTKQATLDFLIWTLTEGQKFVEEAGYVTIDNDKINEYIEKLK
ncbi:MAG: phosphate ABC transporter substrate-binding protein [Bacteroidetes bacterium HGW-Bacteroidetes-4]|jgi:phosphate transport system substrate-binding protein|nr:MAG: phosphate ABC transporter substrate-binding protein [Bacteroidetes bacterium HGW-Bacteroidetes-4]